MATKRNYPPMICNRCNKFRSTLVRCDRRECDFEDYRDVVWSYFVRSPPAKYYFTLSGGVNAGKTYYLITLIHDLLYNQHALDQLKLHGVGNVIMIDPISEKNYITLTSQAKNGQLNLTSPDEPLSFFSLFLFKENGDPPCELVFYNTSGEKIEDLFLDRLVKISAHELKGGAILHFVDPREDTRLNSLLKNPLDSSYGQCKDYNIVDYLHKVMQFETRGVTKVNNPLAICVSKFDLLTHRIPFDIPEDVFLSKSHLDFITNVRKSSEQLAQFMDINSTTIKPITLRKRFSNLEYFALAPYGLDNTPAMWEKRQPKGILDPFYMATKTAENIK